MKQVLFIHEKVHDSALAEEPRRNVIRILVRATTLRMHSPSVGRVERQRRLQERAPRINPQRRGFRARTRGKRLRKRRRSPTRRDGMRAEPVRARWPSTAVRRGDLQPVKATGLPIVPLPLYAPPAPGDRRHSAHAAPPEAVQHILGFPGHHEGQEEHRARGGAHRLGVVDVDRTRAEHYRAGPRSASTATTNVTSAAALRGRRLGARANVTPISAPTTQCATAVET